MVISVLRILIKLINKKLFKIDEVVCWKVWWSTLQIDKKKCYVLGLFLLI